MVTAEGEWAYTATFGFVSYAPPIHNIFDPEELAHQPRILFLKLLPPTQKPWRNDNEHLNEKVILSYYYYWLCHMPASV